MKRPLISVLGEDDPLGLTGEKKSPVNNIIKKYWYKKSSVVCLAVCYCNRLCSIRWMMFV